MNASFEDYRILDQIIEEESNMQKHCRNIKSRKPNGDGLQDLSLHNFIVMRDETADSKFLLQRKLNKVFLSYILKMGSIFYGFVY